MNKLSERLRAWAVDEAEAAVLEVSSISDEQEALLNKSADTLDMLEEALMEALPYVEWYRRHLTEPENTKAKRIYERARAALNNLNRKDTPRG